MDANGNPPSITRAWRIAYGIGLFICVAWPLFLQLMLGTVIRPGAEAPGGVARELGYTFTGLTFAAAIFITWRSGKARAGLAALPPQARPGAVLRETVLYAALCELSALYGLATYALGGNLAERYARSFIALATVMFFVFVPRLQAWLEAAGEEAP
ncbi:hypothetical protein [Mesoterricola sediminis]|uniref:Uncharacterized protein n=1 Tax=Mesoterricola sediminis TaxID=2927980 RepID=A0AA48KE35_9BACT|nr:hypothetical protein [Mesoterricola sediminis]BDU77660.1 hypothetical protein METESE_26180 [Mesoterricola sediminis]